ncbi:MAG: TatD family hydrolase [Spirochaetaceae bacterium]|nr:TatD family hydrolase [Spirochaetaceae bacterium]
MAGSPVCAAAHSREEFAVCGALASQAESPVVLSFGLHPQAGDLSLAGFLEELLAGGRIRALGEAGFDLFTPEYRALLPLQIEGWRIQTGLAARYGIPLVIHCRKALSLIFQDCAPLQKIPACVFHSFPGSPLEARSLLKRGVNAFFSFGKPLLNNNRRAIACAGDLPLERLLAETDAPFQRLRGEGATAPGDIVPVHEAIARIRGIGTEEAAEAILGNFQRVFLGAPLPEHDQL